MNIFFMNEVIDLKRMCLCSISVNYIVNNLSMKQSNKYHHMPVKCQTPVK